MKQQPSQGSDSQATPALLDRLLTVSSRTFALTIPLLPEPTRCRVTVAYLLFRVADTLEDAELWTPSKRRAELKDFDDFLRRPFGSAADRLQEGWKAEPPCAHEGYLELLAALPEVMKTTSTLSPTSRELIIEHTHRTIDGMRSFIERERDGKLELTDVPDLQAYCYAVAGIVGEMLTELFLLDRPELEPAAEPLREEAAKFGEALQLVNILKDSASDAQVGRCYLPPGSPRTEIFELARRDLVSAGRYTSILEQAGAPRGMVGFTALPILLAAATLDRVEQSGAGAKLTRPEVLQIIQRLEQAVEQQAVTALVYPAGDGTRLGR